MVWAEQLAAWHGHDVVLDCRSEYVIIGTLVAIGPAFLELADADLHDLRDTETIRETYVRDAATHGIHPNRRHVLVRVDEIVAVTLLRDVYKQ